MAETKAFPYGVEAARYALESENMPPREPVRHWFRYAAPHGLPPSIGISPGFRDRHGRPLVAPDLVHAEHHLCALVVHEGEIFVLDDSDPYLVDWIAAHVTGHERTFPRAKHSELRDAGHIKEL